MGKQSLAEWIHEARIDGDKALGGQRDFPLTGLALVLLIGGVGGTQKEIATIKLGGSSGKVWQDEELQHLFERKARNFCQDAPGVQYFSLLAFYGASTQPQAEHPFMIRIEAEGGAFFSEPPDAKGEKQQGMRHLEMSQGQVYQQQRHLNEFLGGTIQRMTVERHEMMTEIRDMSKIMMEVMMERASNNHAHRMTELAFERRSDLYKKAVKFAPALVNTVTGRNVFPQETADTALVETIADNLTEEDIMKIAQVLKPELLGPLMARITAHMQKKREEEEERRKLAVRTDDPERDAGGG